MPGEFEYIESHDAIAEALAASADQALRGRELASIRCDNFAAIKIVKANLEGLPSVEFDQHRADLEQFFAKD